MTPARLMPFGGASVAALTAATACASVSPSLGGGTKVPVGGGDEDGAMQRRAVPCVQKGAETNLSIHLLHDEVDENQGRV